MSKLSKETICKICGREFESNIGFGGHIKHSHKISTKEYYDKYLSKHSDGFCKTCGKSTKFKNVIYGYFEYCLKCSHNTEQCKQKHKNTNLKRYGVESVLSSDEIRSKIKKTIKARYGQDEIFKTDHFKTKHKKNSLAKYDAEHPMQNKAVQQSRKYYTYDNQLFDSSWELAVYIWHKDYDIPIERLPIILTYIDSNNVIHKYFPDFRINDDIVEVKGNQYLNSDGTLKDTDKQKCIDSNNVIVWSYNDIKQYLEYCEEKYQDRYWYKKFRYNKPRTIVYVPKVKNNPMTCLICNQTFQNGNYLSAHIRFDEHITCKEYYDTYIKSDNEGKCLVCNKPTKYINFTRGYQMYCCRQCKNIAQTKQFIEGGDDYNGDS